MTLVGRLVAQLARLVGAPLPLEASGRVPVTVIVSGSVAPPAAKLWTRIYERARGFPQVIQSVKSFGGATGLEEIVGARRRHAAAAWRSRRCARCFEAPDISFAALGVQLSLPDWLTPGVIEVVHREETGGQFSFSLSVTHLWAGLVIDQIAFFREEQSL